MTDRPTTHWRRAVAEEAEELAAGTLDPGCACMAELFPDALMAEIDAVLHFFENQLPALADADDAQVLAVVEHVVLALNAVHASRQGTFDTGEREQLCLYLDQALTDAGVDVAALTARQGLGRYALTDRWRTW